MAAARSRRIARAKHSARADLAQRLGLRATGARRGYRARIPPLELHAPARAFRRRQNEHAARRLIACAALAAHGVPLDLCHRIADEMTELDEALARRERGHPLGRITGGASVFQREKRTRFELEPLFDILLEGELGYGKPDRRVFERAPSFFDVVASDTGIR